VAHPVPTTEPESLTAGDTLTFKVSEADYPASDGWTLEYVLQNGTAIQSFSSTASGDDHLVTVAATATAGWAPGDYTWTARATKAAEKYSIRRGRITVTADLTSAADQRSHAEKVLDALEAMLEGKATKDQQGYSIAGRSISRMTPTEIREWRDDYSKKVAAQRRKEARERGETKPSTFVRTRFHRP
jgi:hypothetical protein